MTRFLIVDDSPTIRIMMRNHIQQACGGKVEIIQAEDAAQAITEFRLQKPEVMFLDMNLLEGPGGLEVMKTVLRENPAAKIVVVTGLSSDHPHVLEAISMGAFAYLRKPARLEAVKRVIRDIETESGRMGRIR